jgi:hypothetical protein
MNSFGRNALGRGSVVQPISGVLEFAEYSAPPAPAVLHLPSSAFLQADRGRVKGYPVLGEFGIFSLSISWICDAWLWTRKWTLGIEYKGFMPISHFSPRFIERGSAVDPSFSPFLSQSFVSYRQFQTYASFQFA